MSSEDQSNLAAGLYSVIVSDANSCSSISLPVTITGPASALSGSITSQTDVTIFGGNDGSVTVSGSGGTSPYLYKLRFRSISGFWYIWTLYAGSIYNYCSGYQPCTFDVPVTITQPSELLFQEV